LGSKRIAFFADEIVVQNFGSRMAELRRDPLVQRWVIISDKRGKRPSDFKRTPSTKEKEDIKPGPCAFCPGFEEGTGPETFAVREGGEPNASDWRVRVIVNKFPAVSQDFACGSAVGEGTVFGECRLPAFGSHEVVIETPNHDTPFVDLPVSHICDEKREKSSRVSWTLTDSNKDPQKKEASRSMHRRREHCDCCKRRVFLSLLPAENSPLETSACVSWMLFMDLFVSLDISCASSDAWRS
jgi:hypothetical protein